MFYDIVIYFDIFLGFIVLHHFFYICLLLLFNFVFLSDAFEDLVRCEVLKLFEHYQHPQVDQGDVMWLLHGFYQMMRLPMP